MAVLIGLALAAWFLVALWGSATGVFTTAPGRPPIALLVAVAGPPALFAAAYAMSGHVRAFVSRMDLRWLTAVQSWRILGAMFLVLYAFGLLPGLFAWPAGLGDAAIGLSAPFVLLAIVRGTPTWRRWLVALNVAGLIDFLIAVTTGVLANDPSFGFASASVGRASLSELPLSLIPTFAVPLWIIFHMASLIRVAQSVSAANLWQSDARR